MTLQDKITAAAEYVLRQVSLRPTVALVLGSGLGDYADTLELSVKIPYSQIPNFPQPTVEGHTGAFVFGLEEMLLLPGGCCHRPGSGRGAPQRHRRGSPGPGRHCGGYCHADYDGGGLRPVCGCLPGASGNDESGDPAAE